MCDECKNHGRTNETARDSGISRRRFLTLAAGTVGGLTLLGGCRDEEKGIGKGSASHPSTASATQPATQTASTQASTEPADTATTLPSTVNSTDITAAPAITQPCPDLGSVLFPNKANQSIASATDAPVIIVPRSKWTSAPPNLNQIVPMNGISRITVHHTASAILTDAWKVTACEVENIRLFHSGTKATDRHWADIAYHFVIDRVGRVWQGRPLAYQGAHVHLHNEHNLGIVLLGNFEAQTPAAAQLYALQSFIPFLRDLYHVPLEEVHTHGELGKTSCPGKNLQAFMDRARKKWADA